MKLILEKGRPADVSGRLEKEIRVYDLLDQLGTSRLSFAPAEFMEEFLDIKPGAVSVMGLMNDHEKRVKLVMDKSIYDAEEIGCHPCVSTSSLRLRTKDILEKFLPAVGHDVAVVDLPIVEEQI